MVGAPRDLQAAEGSRHAAIDLEHPARPSAADRHAPGRARDRLRHARVAQLELAAVQRDGLGGGEDGWVEGDRVGAGKHIGQVDRPAQVELAERTAAAARGCVDHQRAGLGLEGADVDRAVKREATLIGRDVVDGARVDGGAAGKQGHRLGRAAIIAQWRQQGVERLGVGAGQVGRDPAGAAVGLADQVVALRSEAARDVRPRAGRVPADDRVAQRGRAAVVRHAAAAVGGGIAADGAVGQRGGPAVVEQSAAVAGGVAADGAVGQRGGPGVVVQSGTVAAGRVAVYGAVNESDNAVVPHAGSGFVGVVAADGAVGQRGRAVVGQAAAPVGKSGVAVGDRQSRD